MKVFMVHTMMRKYSTPALVISLVPLVGERELWNAADSNAIVVKVLVHGDSEHRVNLKVCLHVQVALCFACLRLALLSTHFRVKPTRSVGEFQLHHDAALCSG